jgi:predicted transcriptional regulator
MRWMRNESAKNMNMSIIINFLKHHPGSSFSIIMKNTELKESTLRYHLEKMERKNEVVSKKVGKKRCYFYGKHGERIQEPGSGLTNVQKRVLTIIQENPRISRKEIMKYTGIPGSKLSAILSRLLSMQKIVKVRMDGRVKYEYVSPNGLKERLFKQLVLRLIHGEIDEVTFRELVDEMDRKL